MDFVKTSEAYGYETIAEAEEKALAAKYEEGIGIGFEKGREVNCSDPEFLQMRNPGIQFSNAMCKYAIIFKRSATEPQRIDLIKNG